MIEKLQQKLTNEEKKLENLKKQEKNTQEKIVIKENQIKEIKDEIITLLLERENLTLDELIEMLNTNKKEIEDERENKNNNAIMFDDEHQ